MDLGETLTTNVITDNHDESCYFCTADKKPEDLVNGLTDEEDEDADAKVEGVGFKNNSGKLSSNLGGPPGAKELALSGGAKPCITAAHHLIPGNASLKPSKLMTEDRLWKDGMAKGNIGYEVNSRPNGIWLPGNYAVRPWSSVLDQQAYAFAAIEAWERQFHDAHPDYSREVKDALDKIALKLETSKDIWCEKAKKHDSDNPEERNPLYGLVARLHTTSGRLKRFLSAPVTNWNVKLYTSRFSLAYIMEKKAKAKSK